MTYPYTLTLLKKDLNILYAGNIKLASNMKALMAKLRLTLCCDNGHEVCNFLFFFINYAARAFLKI